MIGPVGTSILVFVFNCLLLLMSVFTIVLMSDLEADLIRSDEACRKANRMVVPSLVIHSLISLLLIYNLRYWVFLCSLVPLIILSYKYYLERRKGRLAYFDPTEILNHNELKTTINIEILKMVVYLVYFFLYLVLLIFSLAGLET